MAVLPSRWSLLLALALAAPSVGCVKQMSHDAVAGALDEQNRDLAAALATDPRFAEAVNELGKALITGSLEGLADEEMNTLLRTRVDEFLGRIVPAITGAIDTELSPALQRAIAANVETALRTALSDRTRADASKLAETVLGVTVATVADGLQRELGPAAERVLVDDVGPGLQVAIEKNVGPAVGLALREQIVPAISSELDAQRTALVKELGETLDDGKDALRLMLAVAGVLLTIVVVIAVSLDRARRRREETLALITETIKSHEGDDRVLELVDAIRERGKGSPEGAYLSEFLRKNRQWKVVRRGGERAVG